jgi:hypothetical protein
MLSVCDGATMARDDHKKPSSQLIDWYRDVTSRSCVDYTIAFAIWARCCPNIELGGIATLSECVL